MKGPECLSGRWHIYSQPIKIVLRGIFFRFLFQTACVASVSSGREANSFSGRAIIGRAQKKLEGGGEERRRKRLPSNPSILKTPVRPRTRFLIGAAWSF